MIRAYVSKKQTSWKDYLPILEFAYNSAKNVSTKFSPFMLMYGFQPRSPITVGLATEKLQHVKAFLQDHMDMLKLARQNVCQAQDRYKKYANEKRRQVVFKEGDYVFLRVPEYSESLKNGPTPKLSLRFCGPFKILRRVGSMAYKLELPANSRVHPEIPGSVPLKMGPFGFDLGFFSLFSDSMADKGKDKLSVEESSSSTRRHRRETAAADTQFMASARTARAPRPSMTAEEQEENDLFTPQLMSMMGTFEQLAKNPRMQKLLKTKDYRTGSQAETSQQATSRQRQVTEPVERVPTVVIGPVQHVTQAQDPTRNGHRSNEQSAHPTIPMHTSFPGYFGGFFSLFSDSMADKGKDKLPVEESSSSTRRHRRETAATDTQFMASARTARAPRPSMTAEEQEENDLFTAQLMSMMGTFEQLATNPRMQKLLKTKDYRTGSQAETSQQATSRQRQVTEPVERVPTVVIGPVQHVTQAQDPARNGHRSNEQSAHPTIPMHTSFPGYFGGGSVFQSMIRPPPGFQGYMPSTGNPMYDNISVQPGFQIVPGSIGMAGTDLGTAGPSRPYVRPMDLSGGTGVSPNTDIPLLKPPVYDSLTPKGKAKDYKEGGQAVKFEPFFGTTDRMKALIFLQQFDATFTGGNFTEASKIRKAASFLKGNALQWWATLLNQGQVLSQDRKHKLKNK
ncbi:hypothetical protein L7F22_029141 [Adiantum nelumboides]|nr:hypothetical protein [Adiantum nelumboides]